MDAVRAERRQKYHEADVVVVGAGIFGCAAAYALANQGRSVILLERWMHEPDRIVGELLQPGGCAALRKLGLGHCLEGIDAVPCYGYHIRFHGDEVNFSYPYTNDHGEVVLQAQKKNGDEFKRPEGRGFHHGRFIMQLRRSCLAHPNITVFETDVTNTIVGQTSPEILGVETRTTVDPNANEKKQDCFFGKMTIIADGYASKFRKQVLGVQPQVKSRFYALELIDPPIQPSGYGHVNIGKASPVLMYAIGSHEVRALIDVPLDHPEATPEKGGVRNYINNVVLPTLPREVVPSFQAALADGKIPKSMPNSWLPPSSQAANPPGILVLGDAMNMRHPLTGGGMTVAFNDVVVLSELLAPIRNLDDHAAVRAVMQRFHWQRKSLSSIINVLAMALYSLFAADSRYLRALRIACFSYFQRGITEEPTGLLGGLIQRPFVLFRHFFTVAFWAIWLNGRDVVRSGGMLLGWLKVPLAVWEGFMILWTACVVFLPIMWQEAL
ncbi:squalene epoxidase-domain-containing protein [Coniella lustricola]|uniref:Squalene monooxygenase n=1 Tax=Coniella lustricola TaxID=2025994 RepID=A0A2T3A307_9PEZI|nr:squalene epoxidase-domain-containing protein [Coniella lustricola]